MGTIIGIGNAIGKSLGSKLNPIPFTATLTLRGTGAGVSTLRLWVTEDITLTLNNAARFYDNSAGTTNEGTTRTVVAGALRTFYLKCPSGTASLIFSDVRNLVRWGDNSANGWVSSTNAASISANVELLTKLTHLRVEGFNTLTGSVVGLVNLTYLFVIGNNTLTGSVAGLTNLTYLYVTGSNTLEFPNVTNLKGLCYLYVSITVTLTSANVNQLLADFWANRDEPKSRTERIISIMGNTTSGAPTGQGITDAANLAAYRSPNNIGTNALWTVLTR